MAEPDVAQVETAIEEGVGVAMGVLRGPCTDAECACAGYQGATDDGGPCLRCGHTPGTHEDKGVAEVATDENGNDGVRKDEDGRVFYDDTDPLGLLGKNGKDTEEDMEARKQLQDLCEWSISGNELKFLEKLGSGRSAKVYKGLYKDETVAIKVLKPLLDEKELRNFKGELDIMRSIHSEHVVKFYGGCFEPKICLVMEYCSNGSLYHLQQRENVEIDWEMCFRLLIETVTGIVALHAENPPIVHRDLKSLNLLVNSENRVKVCDFGLSRYTQGSGDNSTLGKLRGTYAYSAPEVYHGKPYSTKSDVYSIGVIMWELVARVITKAYLRPYKEYKHLRIDFQIIIASAKKGIRPTIPASCPESLRALIVRCWDALPDPRPTADEALEQLKEIHEEYRQNKEAWDKILEGGDAPEAPAPAAVARAMTSPALAAGSDEIKAPAEAAPAADAAPADAPTTTWAHKGIDSFLGGGSTPAVNATTAVPEDTASSAASAAPRPAKKRGLTRTASKKLFKIMKQPQASSEESLPVPAKKMSIGAPQWHHKGADELLAADGSLKTDDGAPAAVAAAPAADDKKVEISSAQWKHFGGDSGNDWMKEDAFEDEKKKKKKGGLLGKFKRKK
mmetsp:Transcript_21273/g.82567  ORF Transcript_21273/g.82567 Transcript_21273/m.82567 type:complete len:619 (-) Transcript_21273:154-2010(-)